MFHFNKIKKPSLTFIPSDSIKEMKHTCLTAENGMNVYNFNFSFLSHTQFFFYSLAHQFLNANKTLKQCTQIHIQINSYFEN